LLDDSSLPSVSAISHKDPSKEGVGLPPRDDSAGPWEFRKSKSKDTGVIAWSFSLELCGDTEAALASAGLGASAFLALLTVEFMAGNTPKYRY
jgi:hypothetical protein